MNNKNISLLISMCLVTLLLGGCFGKKAPQSVQYTAEDAIPYRIAVLPAEFMIHAANSTVHKSVMVTDDDKVFVSDIARSAITNQLAGKGFMPLQKSVVDNTLTGLGPDNAWKSLSDAELCKALNADGIVKVDISSADMITAVAFDLFQLDAQVSITNSDGDLVGKWSDSASKRKVSVPTGLFGLAGTIAEAVFSDPIRRQMRMVVYDWAWNMAQMLPDCPKGPKLPEVIAVDTNVDNKLFGVGRRINVRVDAEPGLNCSFDIGEFKTNIPLSQTSQGVYEGFYVVREGDKGVDEPLKVRMRKSNGIDRLWVESGSLVTIDGILPPAPESVRFRTGREGVELRWNVPKGEDLEEFIIEKGDDPVGEFEAVTKTKEASFTDPDIMQGSTVFYRVRSVDKFGNLSHTDGLIKVVMPQFDERELFGEMSGKLVKGNYVLSFPVTVPEGAKFSLQPGTKIRFKSGARIDVLGEFESLGDISAPVRFLSNGTEGVRVMFGGKAVLSQCEFNGFSNAFTADGGYSEIRSTGFRGGKKSIVVSKTGNYDFKGLRIVNAGTGIVLGAGNGTVVRSSISNCTQGIEFSGGSAEITDNNIFNNEINIISNTKLVLSGNYLGTSSADAFRLKGDVLVKSILDAPYPHGRLIVLVDDKTITPEVLEKQFSELKEKGISSFHAQHYGDAYESLSKALKIKDDRDIYLYLSYTLLALSDDLALSETLTEGISKYPYDVRLHQLYVRYLLNKGDIKQARQVLSKALALSPTDSTLLYLKDYLEQIAAKTAPVIKSEPAVNGTTVLETVKSSATEQENSETEAPADQGKATEVASPDKVVSPAEVASPDEVKSSDEVKDIIEDNAAADNSSVAAEPVKVQPAE